MYLSLTACEAGVAFEGAGGPGARAAYSSSTDPMSGFVIHMCVPS
jgi:hypothetical protein